MTITGGRLNVNKAITSCGPSDFLISPGPAYRVITAASQAQFNINVQSIAGFSGNVSMSVEGLPQGATASFTNPSIMTQGGSVLTVNTDASVRPGRYQLHIVGTSSALQRFGVVLLDLPEYSVQDIGTLPGHTDARATAINNAGQIVGYSYPTFGDNHPFLYSSGLLQGLAPNGGQGVPTAINNQGHVVGTLANPFSGFIHKDGQTTLLPTTLNNEVNSINDLDQITGTVRNAQSLPRVFVYSPGGTVADIGLGNGFGINASSQVAGGTLVDGDYQARLYANGNLIALGLPLNRISIATAINNSGQIAGWVVDDVDGGFFYNNGIANRFGTSSSKPEAINSSGMIVGDNGNQAFMYRNGILNNVNEVIPVDSRSYLVDAHGVNDLGQIAATYFAGDHTRACLISPVALSGLPAQRPPTVIMSNPAAGSSWIDPAKIPLLATVVGDNISKVDFFVDGTLIGTSTTYPYGFIWRTNIVPGFRRFTAVATTIDGQTFASGPNRVSIYYSELQPPFNHSDVGVVGIAGHATALYGNQGTFTLHGSGADIGGTADAFHFVYQILSGDGEVVTRVSTLEPTDPDAKAGVMMREVLTEGSKEASVLVSAAHGISFSRRLTTGGPTTSSPGATLGAPYWVKLVRHGDIFDAYQSSEGAVWTLIGSETIAMAKKVTFGLAVSSHTNADTAQATFDNVVLTQSHINQAPVISIVSPADGASYYNYGTMNIVAKASDADGTITKVEFLYDGQNLITTSTAPPYISSTTGCCGTYTWVARATDDQGAVTYSAPSHFTVTTATAPQQSVFSYGGQINDESDHGVSGVTLTLSAGAAATTTTDQNGNYLFSNLANNKDYTVTPSKAGYRFVPTSQTAYHLNGNELGAYFQAIIVKPNSFQFVAQNQSVNEGDGSATVIVTRVGDVSGAASVDYVTVDGTAKQRSDYVLAAGRLNFAAGESAKSFPILLVDNAYVDGNRVLTMRLSNPLGATIAAVDSTLTIQDNDTTTATTNPLDDADARFFVRQHYSDFLNRSPDAGGFDYWSGQITQCGGNQSCLRDKRIDVSNAFFYEQEYQQTAAYVFRLYRAAFGNNQPFPNPDVLNPVEAKKLPSYEVFARDRATVVGGADLAQGQLALASDFVQRPEFLAKYSPIMEGNQFILAVLQTIHDSGINMDEDIVGLRLVYAQGGRAAVLYRLAEDNIVSNPINNQLFIDAEYNRAFVASQYFGYLRRDADMGGFLFWLNQVNGAPLRDTSKQHVMVCSFITSAEYQQRFSPIASRTNGECDRLPSSLASRSLMIKYLILLSPANLLSLKVFSIWLGFSKHWEL